jgi:phage terminase large subunit
MMAAPERSLHEILRGNPLAFGKRILGIRRWEGQQRIRLAIERHRRTIVRSGNSLGKTHEFASSAVEWLTTNPGGRLLAIGPTYDQVRDGLWKDIRKAYAASKFPLGGRMMADRWVLDDGWDGAIVAVDNQAAIQGRRGKKCFLLLDEAHGIDADLWKTVESLMTAEGSRMVAGGNPLFPHGKFFENHSNPLWHQIHLSAFDHPNIRDQREVVPGAITQLWIDEMRAQYGENSPEWIARVLGEFPAEGTSQLISLATLDASAKAITGIDEKPRAGLDVALDGDQCVLVIYDKNRRLIHCEAWRERDTMVTAGRAIATCQRFGAILRVDRIGIGAGVADRVREQGYPVDLVDFGAGPVGDWSEMIPAETKLKNRRAELYYAMRMLLRAGQVSIGEQWKEVRADLCAPTYSYDSTGAIVIEKKDSIRKRIGRSPDHGDASVIALSNCVNDGPGVEFF